MTKTPPSKAYLLRMDIARLLNAGADFEFITGIINRRSNIDPHVREHLLAEATFFDEHGEDLGLVFVIDVGDGPLWSRTLRAHVKVVEGAPMFQCSDLQASVSHNEVEVYHLLRGYICSVMSSTDYNLSGLIDFIQDLEVITEAQKIGIIAELLYYHENSGTVVWALDAGDHADFFDIARSAYIDVTTNLSEKRLLVDMAANANLVRPDFLFAELQLHEGFHPKLSRARVLLDKQILEGNFKFREIAASRLAMNWTISHHLLFGAPDDPFDIKSCAKALMNGLICDELEMMFPKEFEFYSLTREGISDSLDDLEDDLYDFAVKKQSRQSVLVADLLDYLNDVVFKSRSKTKPFGNLFAEFAHFKVECDGMVPKATGLVLLDSIHAEHLHYPAEVVS